MNLDEISVDDKLLSTQLELARTQTEQASNLLEINTKLAKLESQVNFLKFALISNSFILLLVVIIYSIVRWNLV